MPYYSRVLELELAIIAELVGEIGALPSEEYRLIRVDCTEAEVANAALRLLCLLARPTTLAVLGDNSSVSCAARRSAWRRDSGIGRDR